MIDRRRFLRAGALAAPFAASSYAAKKTPSPSVRASPLCTSVGIRSLRILSKMTAWLVASNLKDRTL